MKKLLALSLAMLLALSLAACAGGNEETTTTMEPTTIATTALTTIAPAETEPAFDYMELFNRLEGYWNTEVVEGTGSFIGFIYRNSKPWIEFGFFDSEGNSAQLTGGRSTDENTAELTVLFSEEVWGEDTVPEISVTILLDFSGLENDRKININIESPNAGIYDGIWRAYTFVGATFKEAGQAFELARIRGSQ